MGDHSYSEVRSAYRFLHEFHTRLRSNHMRLVREIDHTAKELLLFDTIYNKRPNISGFRDRRISDYFPLLSHRIIMRSETNSSLIVVDTHIDSAVSEDLFVRNASQTMSNDFRAGDLSNVDQCCSYMETYFIKHTENLKDSKSIINRFYDTEYTENSYGEVDRKDTGWIQVCSKIYISELEKFDDLAESLKKEYDAFLR